MRASNVVLDKITDIMIWDDTSTATLNFVVDSEKSVVYAQKTGKEIPCSQKIVIIENRIGKEGLNEITNIMSALDWTEISMFVLLSHTMSEIIAIDKKIVTAKVRGYREMYGVDPDYYYSLVPVTGPNHKNIESFILSMKGKNTIMENIKYLIKKIMILLSHSNPLYDQHVLLFYPK